MNRSTLAVMSLITGIILTGLAAAANSAAAPAGPAAVPATNPADPAARGRGGRRGGGGGASASQPSPRTDANSQTAHVDLLAKKTKGKIDVYVEGDSIARRWGTNDPSYAKYLANWNENFFGWNVADFGWGADSLQNINWRLQNGELDGVNPKVIVFLGGTNNLGGGGGDAKAADIAGGIKAILDIFRQKAPDAVVILTGIFPRGPASDANRPVIKKVNEIVATYADGKKVRFLDVNDKMVDKDGTLLPGMMNSDNLHPHTKGYQVWADGLKPILREILGPPAKVDLAPPPTGDASTNPNHAGVPATAPAPRGG